MLQADTQATLRRLSPVTLMAVLRSDNLRVPSEMHVFNSVVSWLEADSTRLEQVLCPDRAPKCPFVWCVPAYRLQVFTCGVPMRVARN